MEQMTWIQMTQQFPDEWLLIVDFELDQHGKLLSGVVKRHSKEKHWVYRQPKLNQPVAFRYTGESTFAGLRSYAQNHSL